MMKKLKIFVILFLGMQLSLQAQTVLTGDYNITGNLQIGNTLDVMNTDTNAIKSVLARLPGETTLEVKSFNILPINGKLFSIENYFYFGRNKNSAINFYRGGYEWSDFITFDVYDGRPMVKFSYYGIEVNGTVKSKEVLVSNINWADYVFDKDYRLPSLNEVKQYITENNHLPGIPTETEVKENGVNLGDMQVKLLQKIEELTLYTIQQQEMIEMLKDKIEELEKEKK